MTEFLLPYKQEQHPKRVAAAKRAEILTNPGFGKVFTDHMVSIDWDVEHGWDNATVEPFGPLSISPSTTVLHYGQEIFEGMKAYRHPDGSVHVFRPLRHAARFRKSAARMALPKLPVDDFVESLRQYLLLDHDWVPSGREQALYIRPFMFANEITFGIHATQSAEYHVIGSPAGSYLGGRVRPVNVWVETEFTRAAPRGTGFAKTGGNYAGAMVANQRAHKRGCEQVLFLDAMNHTYLEEMSSMNVFVVDKNNVIRTPKLTGSILDGVTRDSVMQLAKDHGYTVREENIVFNDLLEDIRMGYVTEMFATGTAGIITPVGALHGEGDLHLELGVDGSAGGTTTLELREALLDIQHGVAADEHDWLMKLF